MKTFRCVRFGRKNWHQANPIDRPDRANQQATTKTATRQAKKILWTTENGSADLNIVPINKEAFGEMWLVQHKTRKPWRMHCGAQMLQTSLSTAKAWLAKVFILGMICLGIENKSVISVHTILERFSTFCQIWMRLDYEQPWLACVLMRMHRTGKYYPAAQWVVPLAGHGMSIDVILQRQMLHGWWRSHQLMLRCIVLMTMICILLS